MHGLARVGAELMAALIVCVAFFAGMRMLASRAFGTRGRMPRIRVRGARSGWVAVPVIMVTGIFRMVSAFIGMVARGGSVQDGATWWRSAGSVRRRPSLDPLAGRAGALRVLVYLVLPPLLAFGLAFRPLMTAVIAGAALALTLAVWIGQREVHGHRERTRAAFLAMASYLGLDPEAEDYRHWLKVPRAVRDRQAVITVALPRQWAGTERQRDGIASVIGQRFPGQWEPDWQPMTLTARFTRPPEPPAVVPFADDGGPVHRFPMGVSMRGAVRHIDFEQETPNVLISASPGWGKTLFIAHVVAWFVSRGAQAVLLDGKRTSYLRAPRKIPFAERGFNRVPGITIHADLPAMMDAISDVRKEMDHRYTLRSGGTDIDDEKAFPTILLAVDEISRFTTEVRMWWTARKGKGMPPCFADWLAVLWQGREARIYCIAGVHNPNARVLVSGDARSMFATRVAAGPQDAGAWRMLFGNRPVPRFSSRKGRAWVAMGVDADEYQLYYGDLQDARALALSGGGPSECPSVPAPDSPAETRPDVADNGTWPHRAGRVSWPAPPPRPAAEPAGLIVGLDAAARYLDTTYEAFKKLRERNGPIPAEQRVGISPAWPESELRDWYAKLPRAGKKLPPVTGRLAGAVEGRGACQN